MKYACKPFISSILNLCCQFFLDFYASAYGHAGIDHGYLHVDAERYVPLIFFGNGIKEGVNFDLRPSIIDINPTIMYLLGIDYLKESRGRVLTRSA